MIGLPEELHLAHALCSFLRGKHYYINDLKAEATEATKKGDDKLRDCLTIRIREAEVDKGKDFQSYNQLLKRYRIIYNPLVDDFEIQGKGD